MAVIPMALRRLRRLVLRGRWRTQANVTVAKLTVT